MKHLRTPGISLISAHRFTPIKIFFEYVPTVEKSKWQTKVLEVVQQAPIDSAIELYLKLKELDLLAQRIEKATDKQLMDLSHYRTEPAAKKLEKRFPLAAAKLYRALGMRILESKKSKYYEAAQSHFQKAKKLYEASSSQELWDQLVKLVRKEHRLKRGFIQDFELIVNGVAPKKNPSFQQKIQGRLARFTED